MSSTSHAITFKFEANLDGCAGATINGAVSRDHFMLQRISVPANASHLTLTGLSPDTSYLCDITITTTKFGVTFAEQFDCFTGN